MGRLLGSLPLFELKEDVEGDGCIPIPIPIPVDDRVFLIGLRRGGARLREEEESENDRKEGGGDKLLGTGGTGIIGEADIVFFSGPITRNGFGLRVAVVVVVVASSGVGDVVCGTGDVQDDTGNEEGPS